MVGLFLFFNIAPKLLFSRANVILPPTQEEPHGGDDSQGPSQSIFSIISANKYQIGMPE